MARSFNQVILMGNLTRDPELRNTPNGQSVCSFSLALNRSYKGADGNWVEATDYVDVVAWGPLGERVVRGLGIRSSTQDMVSRQHRGLPGGVLLKHCLLEHQSLKGCSRRCEIYELVPGQFDDGEALPGDGDHQTLGRQSCQHFACHTHARVVVATQVRELQTLPWLEARRKDVRPKTPVQLVSTSGGGRTGGHGRQRSRKSSEYSHRFETSARKRMQSPVKLTAAGGEARRMRRDGVG